VKLAQAAGWQVCVIATPDAVHWIDPAMLATLTGDDVRSEYRAASEAKSLPEGRRYQPYRTHQHPEPALHLLGGIWIASCPTCPPNATRPGIPSARPVMAGGRARPRGRSGPTPTSCCAGSAPHRRQLVALYAAGLANQVQWQRPGLATGQAPSREATS
jgi:hypothetical protein